MYDENGFEKENSSTNEVYTECRVVEPQDHKKKSGRKKKFAKFAAGLLCAALIAGGGFAAGSLAAKPSSSYETGQNGNSPEDDANSDSDSSGNPSQGNQAGAQSVNNLLVSAGPGQGKPVYTPAQIAEKYLSSVVAITAKSTSEVYNFLGGKQEYESEGAGSGIIVAKTDQELIIATNNHVVEGAKELTVCFNDSAEQIYSAYIKGTDPSNDLAVVGIKLSDIPEKVLDTLTVAVLGDSNACVMGEQVVAIGNALGYGQSLTSGYISALDRVVTVDNVTYTLIQIDAAINPGNSGGALFNMHGEVIGINSVKFASSKVEGMGFAIPISKALPILNRLAEREPRELVAESEQGYLGITGNDVTSSVAGSYNMPVGAHVRSVTEGSAAEKAGLLAGDIITGFDGMAVSGMQQLKGYLQYYRSGETVEITVKRLESGSYTEKKLSLTLGERPEDLQDGTQQEVQQEPEDEWNFGDDFFDGLFRFPQR